MSEITLNGQTTQDLAKIYKEAQKCVDNKKSGKQGDTIFRLSLTNNGPEHTISVETNGTDKIRGLFKTWAKRNDQDKLANNTTRNIFKKLVLTSFGLKEEEVNQLPKKLRDAMNLDDYDGKGHPLSARRIVDTYTAFDNWRKASTTKNSNHLYSVLHDPAKRANVDTTDVHIVRSSEVRNAPSQGCTKKFPLLTMSGSSSHVLHLLKQKFPNLKIGVTIAADGTETGGGLFRDWTTQEESQLRDANEKTLVKLIQDGYCDFEKPMKKYESLGKDQLMYKPGQGPAVDPYVADIQLERVDNNEISDPIQALAGFISLPSLTWKSHSFDKQNALDNLNKCRTAQNNPLSDQQKTKADKAIDLLHEKITNELKDFYTDDTGNIYERVPQRDQSGKVVKNSKGKIQYERGQQTQSKSGYTNAKVFSKALKAFSFSNAADLDILDCDDEQLDSKIDELLNKINADSYNMEAVEENYKKELVSKFEAFFKAQIKAGADVILALPVGCGAFMNDPEQVIPAMVEAYFNVGSDKQIIWNQFNPNDGDDIAMRKSFENHYNQKAAEKGLQEAPQNDNIITQEKLDGFQELSDAPVEPQLTENDFHLLEPEGKPENNTGVRNEGIEQPRSNVNAQQNTDEVDTTTLPKAFKFEDIVTHEADKRVKCSEEFKHNLKEIAKSQKDTKAKQQEIEKYLKEQIAELLLHGKEFYKDAKNEKTQVQHITDGRPFVITDKNGNKKRISVSTLAQGFADMRTFSQAQDEFYKAIDELLELKYSQADSVGKTEKAMIDSFAYLVSAEDTK